MNPKAMEPHGAALLAYFKGEASAELVLRREDGLEGRLPVSRFFRPPAAFTPLEVMALSHCRGCVLDAGAGTGLHSLALQARGLRVTAIDVSPQAVEILAKRGVEDVHCSDVFEFHGGPFDTILLLGHGIGLVESLGGLNRFLAHARGLVSENGQVLLDSLDVRATTDPRNLEYQESRRRAGQYPGEIRLQFEFQGKRGPCCGWLHVDPETLREHAARSGWTCDVLLDGGAGEYLARLAPGSSSP